MQNVEIYKTHARTRKTDIRIIGVFHIEVSVTFCDARHDIYFTNFHVFDYQ